MIAIAAVILSLTALGGAVLLGYVLFNKPTPKGLSIIHGAAAFLGIVLLATFALTTDAEHRHIPSLVLFVVAALGGGFLIYRDITGKSIPKWLAIGHGLIALFALGLILYHLL